ncbi:MAG TPA: OmpA family protein [Gemmatimonadaceae bacterium]|nr:OmpA family protein [Gemmatimonadaceae bacterium]
MKTQLKTVAAMALAAPLVVGCASKGFVKEQVAAEAARADSNTAAQVTGEKNARVAADSAQNAALTAQVADLKRDLDSLRSEFGAKVTAMENGMEFALPVHFAFDDATVRDEDKPALDRFAKVAQKYYPSSPITVEGFADPAGGTKYNQTLSQHRAESVRDYLSTQGLTDLKAVGYGKTRYVVPNAQKDDPGAELNRRVVFVIESKDNGPAGVASIGQ